MLGAAHALANPLTADFGIAHGVAVGLMLPHIVRFNAAAGSNPYADLIPEAEVLAQRIEAMLAAGSLPARLSECGVPPRALAKLAAAAAKQWTATFNPRTVGEAELLSIYQMALG
jgi:alcohol dehydrogenase